MGGLASLSGNQFECCVCGRSVTNIEDLRAKSPVDVTFLQQYGRYQDSRYYASSRVLTNVGFCSSKCFKKKLIPQIQGNIDETTIVEQINAEAKLKLAETLHLDINGLSKLQFISERKLRTAFSVLKEDAQSIPLDSSVLHKSIGRGHGKTGAFYFKKFPVKFNGHNIAACSLNLDDGGARNCAITVVVFFICDTIEFTKRPELEHTDTDSEDHDPFDALTVF